jgi:1,4-alpha-glucan branching enzyme
MKDTDRAEIAGFDAIAAADHGNPFGFLGMHGGEAGGLVVRCFHPGAERVDVIDAASGKAVARMRRVGVAGGYSAVLAEATAPFAYRLRIKIGTDSFEIEDPFRFPPLLGEIDLHLLGEGSHFRSFDKLGAHLASLDGVDGVNFAVWAPNAKRVSVVGDFNFWDGRRHPMRLHPGCGVWEIFVPGIGPGAIYKFEIRGADGTVLPLKADPYAFQCERPPKTGSVVTGPRDYSWSDQAWIASRADSAGTTRPMSVYEVHLGSWRRVPEDGGRYLTYAELAEQLVPYVADLGFTHIELLPINEYPFDGSWGYQPIGLFAPTSRFGSADDFRAFVDACHRHGVGVIVDWVPGHFPEDAHGLVQFDGTHLYEHADPRQGRHMDWGTLIYNFDRSEVANFLISNALYWLEAFHIDGLRVDAVASMLYLDYSREGGDWIPNRFGGNENLGAVAFLKRLNEVVYAEHPGTFTVAEESTAWPMVSKPTYLGGLGFGFKWNMGWMHDTLRFISKEPVHRKYHHNDLTFGMLYAFHENFVLPLSHDEVVHGKGSILGRMPGDAWQRYANLRAYYAFMFMHPGKKLLFMGSEFGQEREWNHDTSLDWHLVNEPLNAGVQNLIRDLNCLYRGSAAAHEGDGDPAGFAWIDCTDSHNSVVSFLRYSAEHADFVVVICNFTPVVRHGYRVGVPRGGHYREALNTDSGHYGGGDVGNGGGVEAEAQPMHGHEHSVAPTLPPLATLVLVPDG